MAARAYDSVKEGRLDDATAAAAVGRLHLGLTELARDVLADSAASTNDSAREREWRHFRSATGVDL